MTGSERDVLMRFLRELAQTRPVVYDDIAARLISQSLSQQPYATYLLVQRVLLMEAAQNPSRPENEAFTEFLRSDATAWSGDGSQETTEFRDMSLHPRQLSTVELGLKAMERNSKIIWTVIFAAFVVVLLIR
ncbi:MAG: hypothetical protein RL541_423 [Pseudomonadota bacterium]|jgi:hypothetical protein